MFSILWRDRSDGSRAGARGTQAPLILGKKEEITGGRKAGRTIKIALHPPSPPPSPQAQGVDPPLTGEKPTRCVSPS